MNGTGTPPISTAKLANQPAQTQAQAQAQKPGPVTPSSVPATALTDPLLRPEALAALTTSKELLDACRRIYMHCEPTKVAQVETFAAGKVRDIVYSV